MTIRWSFPTERAGQNLYPAKIIYTLLYLKALAHALMVHFMPTFIPGQYTLLEAYSLHHLIPRLLFWILCSNSFLCQGGTSNVSLVRIILPSPVSTQQWFQQSHNCYVTSLISLGQSSMIKWAGSCSWGSVFVVFSIAPSWLQTSECGKMPCQAWLLKQVMTCTARVHQERSCSDIMKIEQKYNIYR